MSDAELEKMAEESNRSFVHDNKSYSSQECLAELKRQFIAGYKKAREWISVKERLPEKSGKYLVIRFPGDSGSDLMWTAEYRGWNIPLDQDRSNEMFPTHWMPLPAKPEGVE